MAQGLREGGPMNAPFSILLVDYHSGDPVSDDIPSDGTAKHLESLVVDAEQAAALTRRPVAIRWHRHRDGQTAYWGPHGAQLQPYAYQEEA